MVADSKAQHTVAEQRYANSATSAAADINICSAEYTQESKEMESICVDSLNDNFTPSNAKQAGFCSLNHTKSSSNAKTCHPGHHKT
jgi:hypothetical protein